MNTLQFKVLPSSDKEQTRKIKLRMLNMGSMARFSGICCIITNNAARQIRHFLSFSMWSLDVLVFAFT